MVRIEKLSSDSALCGFRLFLHEKLLLLHTPEEPALFLAVGHESVSMYRGNFTVDDSVTERVALRCIAVTQAQAVFALPKAEEGSEADKHPVAPIPGEATPPAETERADDATETPPAETERADDAPDSEAEGRYILDFTQRDGYLYVTGRPVHIPSRFNRLYLRLAAEADEHITGGGEQFSALDLRGRSFPIWTREQGVGRNKATAITRLADASDGGGGDYHTTYYPQPTFLSSRMYGAHWETYGYCELDFQAERYHELTLWETSFSLALFDGEDYGALLTKLTALTGRQPPLPDWAMKGVWLGVQGGTERATALRDRCRAGGVDVSAVWVQDWEGKRVTSFGKRLQWDWRWNRELYPRLDRVIAADSAAWMGYINPYLVEGGVLFREAREKGFFVKNPRGEDYLFDFGEFNCGVVDLTMPQAFDWYKGVIQRNLIGMGFRGWMADFGEYLPADALCFGGNGKEVHNLWPVLWAKCNRLALEESGKLGECVFFMRSGAAQSGRYATLVWAGDQCVDWSYDDGLPSVITGALTLGMSGFGLHTSDAGGYTTLFGLKRDRELLLRWLEFACFTPVMRTHEGNRPEENLQLYSDGAVIDAAARLTAVHNALNPYLKECVRLNAEKGHPVMRPLFWAAPREARAYERDNFSYLLGEELLVAPVIEPDAFKRRLWLPEGIWIHLWSGARLPGGERNVPAPMGQPPVFYRPNSRFRELFAAIGRHFGSAH